MKKKISRSDDESWKETREILSNSKLMERIRQGEKDIREGKTRSWKEIKRFLEEKK